MTLAFSSGIEQRLKICFDRKRPTQNDGNSIIPFFMESLERNFLLLQTPKHEKNGACVTLNQIWYCIELTTGYVIII